MKGKWKKLFLILLLPIMIFIEGCSCAGIAGSGGDDTTGYPCRVHFYLGTTDADVLEIDFQEVPSGGTVTRPKDPVWEDHFFEGWYKDTECTKPWNFALDTVREDTWLYANWLGQYTVTFNLHSLSCIPTAISPRYVVENNKIEDIPTPEWSGYIFDGWYLDEGYVDTFDIYSDVVTGNITLHAKWIKKK